MKFSEKELQAVIKAVPPTEVYAALKTLDQVKSSIAVVRAEAIRATDQYEKTMKIVKQRIAEIEKGCPHYSTSYEGDPSGNNDSQTTCDTCGAEL